MRADEERGGLITYLSIFLGSPKCVKSIMMAPIKRTQNGTWIDMYTNKLVDMNPFWKTGQPNGRELQKCAGYDFQTSKFWDLDCPLKYCFVCIWEDEPLFHLKGLCKDSQIDMSYVLLPNWTFDDHFVFSGFDATNIIFSKVNNSWLIVDDTLAEIQKAVESSLAYEFKVLGIFKPDKFSNQLPIGLKRWDLKDEDCLKNITLKLTVVSLYEI